MLAQRYTWSELDEAERREVLQRPAVAAGPETLARVREILAAVRSGGDAALQRLTRELDGAELTDFRVGEAEFAAARAALGAEQIAALRTAIDNITAYHAQQRMPDSRTETAPGVVCERITRPIPAVGLYVPAGTAPLPSTAIMLAVPSGIAGCPVRVLCTPPRPDGTADPAVLVAAAECGITDVFKLGGAQAIAALAYGTATVPKVDKIFGPGNAWVTAAKTEVAADPAGAALDMPAGPSEVMVIADAEADPRAVALDLLSQAEHGTDSQVVLVTTSVALADAAAAEVEAALPEPVAPFDHGTVAPAQPGDLRGGHRRGHCRCQQLRAGASHHAGAGEPGTGSTVSKTRARSFLGPYTPESVGDYCSGTNHVLPTYGYARAYSGLSVFDFQKRMSVQELTADGVRGLQPTVSTLAGWKGSMRMPVPSRCESSGSMP